MFVDEFWASVKGHTVCCRSSWHTGRGYLGIQVGLRGGGNDDLLALAAVESSPVEREMAHLASCIANCTTIRVF